jgi:Tfp pilus assembly protein PilF
MAKQLLPTLLLAFCAQLITAVHAAEFERIGSFDFPSSGSAAAQEHFLLGVGYLHSFGLTQAQAEFRKAQQLEPDFAMAYWGEVFTYQHPFFGQLDDGPGQALLRLGATTGQRLAKAPSAREKGFLKAAEAYALTPGDMAARRIAWMNAMAELYTTHPNDDEVKAFYTVALLAGATASGPMRERLNMQAGALALQLFKKNGNHPGAAHYVIHAFDDPVHAPIALEAAYKYADIAPAVSHARHMPTHIFIQHGKWHRVSQWNESAFALAKALWQPGDSPGDQNHSSDWGQYGDLQLADEERSSLWIVRAEQLLRENPGNAGADDNLRRMRSRHIIETEHWQLQPLTDDLRAPELLALGLSAANLGEQQLAQAVADRLAELAANMPPEAPLHIVHTEVAAMAMLMRAQEAEATLAATMQEQAIAMLEESIALTEQGRLPNGAASPLKPVHELTGEVMLQSGRADRAAALFEQSLLRTPNRSRSLLGAARAHAALNHRAVAAARYEALLANWNDDSHPAVREAKQYLGY